MLKNGINKKYPYIYSMNAFILRYPHIVAYPTPKVNSYTTVLSGVKFKKPLFYKDFLAKVG